MIVHDGFKQGDLEWALLRAGIPTASEFDKLLTPEFKLRDGEMPKTYLATKVAEAWQGGPLPSFQSEEMNQGQILEQEVIPWYELEFGLAVQRPAFIQTDDRRVGCSPDGIIADSYGIEIKCPEAHTHTKYVLNGDLPKDHRAQVHGGMYVTGLQRWQFISYRRHFPKLVLMIERDEEIQAQIHEALTRFRALFDMAMDFMQERYGIERPAWKPYVPQVREPRPLKPDNRIPILSQQQPAKDIIP